MVGASRGAPADRRFQRPGSRPAHVHRLGSTAPAVTRSSSRPRRCPWRALVYDRVLRTQRADVAGGVDDGARMVAPVTDRGDAIGLLELRLPLHPLPPGGRRHRQAPRTRWPTSSSPPAGTPTCSSGACAPPRSPWPRRSSADCCRPPSPARPGSSPSPDGWNRPIRGRWGHLRLHPRPRQLAGVDHRRGRPSGRGVAAGHRAGRRPAQRPPQRKWISASRRATPTTALAENAPPGQFVTGQLFRVDLRSGMAVIVNAGHELPSAAPRRCGGGNPSSASRCAVRRAARQDLPGAGLPAGARRPGSSSSPTPACWSATRHHSGCGRRPWPTPRTCTRGRSCTPWGRRCWDATGGDLRDDATMVCLDWYGWPAPRLGTPRTVPTQAAPRPSALTAATPDRHGRAGNVRPRCASTGPGGLSSPDPSVPAAVLAGLAG